LLAEVLAGQEPAAARSEPGSRRKPCSG